MPRNQFQRCIFALMTVIITVHSYVFYSLYVINGDSFITWANAKGAYEGGAPVSHVLDAINVLGGVELCGATVPIWAVVLVEFILAYSLEMLMGSPLSFRLACKVFDPRETHPVLFESAIICATVGLMCPAMSLIAAFLYYPYGTMEFNMLTLLANWAKLVCFNFPFAFFSQLFFIQPLVRTMFRLVFRKDIAARKTAEQHA
ncbi:MAG: hypothetical protein IJZ47_09105 [Oscillospiraceae bacterium]|nr:hypothetical protein [Oscillospiraceae bacterium]